MCRTPYKATYRGYMFDIFLGAVSCQKYFLLCVNSRVLVVPGPRWQDMVALLRISCCSRLRCIVLHIIWPSTFCLHEVPAHAHRQNMHIGT